MSETDPSQVLRPRLERFAQLLASPERRSAAECWVLSDANPIKPEVTPGREVTASRNQNRPEVKARVAFLRAERAAATEQTDIDADGVAELMEKVTEKFLSIGELADQLGLSEMAAKLRRMTTLHAGRAERLHRHVPEAEDKPAVDLDAQLSRLKLCDCR